MTATLLLALALLSPDSDCLECHQDLDEDEREFTFPGGETISFVIGEVDHGKDLGCTDCHPGYEKRHRGFPDDSYGEYLAKRSDLCGQCHDEVERRHEAPCLACHSVHRKSPPISRRCGACHDEVLREFDAGAHAMGISAEDPNPDLPRCGTCHDEHGAAGTDRRVQGTASCIRCHSSDYLIEKYDLPKGVSRSYSEDFHGVTFRRLLDHTDDVGSDVLICADCHGPHRVEVIPRDELAKVCVKCHEGADPRMVGAWLGHKPLGPRRGAVVWGLTVLYYIFIPVVVGGLSLIIFLQVLHRRRSRTVVHPPIPDHVPAKVTRFGPVERSEHFLGMVIFTTLVLTGLPQSYPETALGDALIDLWGGIGSCRAIHRFCGYTFAALLLLHLGRGVILAVARGRTPAILLTKQDFRDTYQTLLYYLGKADAPRFGRFDFGEKFEYWGLLLGGTAMTVTGFALLFPEGITRILPGILVAAARTVHGLEATLAVLVVIVWHFYGVIFRPEVFPLDTSIWTGKISTERLREEHPLEYDEMFPPS